MTVFIRYFGEMFLYTMVTISSRSQLKRLLINILLIISLALLLIGLFIPIITVEKFYLFSNTVSLVSALQQLWFSAEWGLFILLLIFSVLFPIGKIALLLFVCNLPSSNTLNSQRWLNWVAVYGKWSMLDVFVVALLVVTVKLGALAQATVELGIYAFAASVILTLFVSQWISHQDANR